MIELRRKGETHRIRTEKSRKSINGAFAKVKMTWETGIDLDVHAFAFTAGGAFVHIFFGDKESTDSNICLDFDAGVGNVAGNNEENLIVRDLSKIKKIVFAANIFRFFGNLFSSGDNFGNYDGKIHINALGEQIVVFLNSKEAGRWALIAAIEISEGMPTIRNVNEILREEPDMDYIASV